jgi:uncharacterized protein
LIYVLSRPDDLFDRTSEWAALCQFVESNGAENRLAIVLGRRRQGKSMLVRSIVQASDGFYFEAAQQSSAQNLDDFSRAWAHYSGNVGLSFASWSAVVEHIAQLPKRASPRVIAIDEVGYLIDSTPELPSLLQRLFTEQPAGALRIVLCGSAFAQMRQLLSPSAALRGRQHQTLQVNPFDYRTAATYWGLDANPDAAFRLHALIGGTPAYRRFTTDGPLADGDVDRFAAQHLLTPTSGLHGEGRAVVAEDHSLQDKSLYWAVLNAVAEGSIRRSDVARALDRPDSTTLVLTEPMLRTERILLAPERARIDRGRAVEVWQDAQPRLARRVYGPHLEWMASEWALSFAAGATVGGDVRSAAPAMFVRRGVRSQIDVIAVAPDRDDVERVCAIGECKAGVDPMALSELHRLDGLVHQLSDSVPPSAKRLLFARSGFTAELKRAARQRGDVELIDLQRLYHGS